MPYSEYWATGWKTQNQSLSIHQLLSIYILKSNR